MRNLFILSLLILSLLILGAALAGQGEVRIEAIRFFYFVESDSLYSFPDTVDHPANPHTATLEELEIWSVGGGTNADVVLMIAIIRNQTGKTLTKCKVNVEIIWKFGPFNKWGEGHKEKGRYPQNYDRKDTSKE